MSAQPLIWCIIQALWYPTLTVSSGTESTRHVLKREHARGVVCEICRGLAKIVKGREPSITSFTDVSCSAESKYFLMVLALEIQTVFWIE